MTLLVVGSVNADLAVRAPHIPAPGETVLGGDVRVSPGGKGANQAVAAALAGARVTLCGAVGHDPFREAALRGLTRAGVDLTRLHTLDTPTGLALITVAEGGENAITVASGANARMTPEQLPADLTPHTHLLLQGELPAGVTREAARRGHAAGLAVLLNAAPAQAPDPELLAHVTHLLVNEAELAALAPSGGDVEAQARALLASGPQAVTVTLGARGSLTVTEDETYAFPALPVTPVDTTGAGDTFAGVLAAELVAGSPLPEALRAAGVAASLTCTRPGAQDAMPTREEILAALRR
ncbi:ribokinase [Deinococcus sp. SDU3-2]|uniref:Ribokinase n=1 Tax=Deinococcus terrestris TaxID=2651870 RepID=A0A7X1NTX8_9DEIO|nr:ribokinase [Deinococcus terrestris]MPY65805.1 ribokinase [Deinococcus terrestris]